MPELLPFRPWTLREWDSDLIAHLKNPERKPDDRSPFVRYARSAALWAEWVRDQVVHQGESAENPTVHVNGHAFRLGITLLDHLRPLVSVLPSAKEPVQRLLEGLQVYVDPIVVVEQSDGSYLVVGNPELFAAAQAYQEEVARPGRTRSSDYCLVAVADSSYLESLEIRPLVYEATRPFEEIANDLLRDGYALSPRQYGPNDLTIDIDGKTFVKSFEANSDWKLVLVRTFGIKTLDNHIKLDNSKEPLSGKKIVLTTPRLSQDVHDIGTERPYGSVIAREVPISGAAMWSLRGFSAE